MLLGTYQPLHVMRAIREKGQYKSDSNHFRSYTALKEMFGFNPIFALELKSVREFMVETYMSCPSAPQYLIIFEANVIQRIDYLNWNQARGNKMYVHRTDRFSEVIVPEISNVKSVICISKDPERSNDILLSKAVLSLPEVIARESDLLLDCWVNNPYSLITGQVSAEYPEMTTFIYFARQLFEDATLVRYSDVEKALQLLRSKIFTEC